MDDILIPKERRDAVVLIGVDRSGSVEFIKVYAVSEEKAKETLEEFFSAKGLFPSDYRLVSRGAEETGGKAVITTRSESSLGASLSRLGLRLLSNGVLYLEGVDRVYQFTLVSEDLYRRITSEKAETGPEFEPPAILPEDVLSLGLDTLVENLRGIELDELLPEGAVLLREPPVDRVAEILAEARDYPVVIETKDTGKYGSLDFPVVLRLPPLSPDEFAAELSAILGFEVGAGYFLDYPPEKLGLRNAKALARLVRVLVEKRGLGEREALALAVRLNLGEP
ncbi:hypothetical protein FH039_02705 [Thermococcus indicus]|uniref:Uncharacterized protein n=2 Tax=Thermococcus indicus TaxID=2586643 RepID=A0A4Y5SPR1_9EURY|nr:hypothetical protein [Thermococcus indicus]QDA32269.1 hypothetical protein FH039_02705 [Thermococcus indicus]